MSNWLLFVSWVALMSLNAVDALMTRTALRKGHSELNKLIKDMIDKFGLDSVMLLKALLPTPLVILVIFGWNSPVFGLIILEAVFIVPMFFYIYVLFHNCRQLLKHKH